MVDLMIITANLIKAFQSKKRTFLDFLHKKQWVTSQPPIAHFNLNLNYEKFICLFTLQRYVSKFILPNKTTKKDAKGKDLTF